MNDNRRSFLKSIAATPAIALTSNFLWAQSVTSLRISHQFPGSSGDEGDFRDRLCRKFASEIAKRTNNEMKATVYPGASLMKTNAQFSSMRKGALDMSLVPLSYAGGEIPETNIGLMPGTVTSYEQAASWKKAEVGKTLANVLADKGVLIVSWIWQAGGVASRVNPLVNPEDAAGMKVRGGSREMDMILKAVGATVLTLPSNEIYAAMQTGALDAAMTSSTSLISFRLEEVGKALTTGRGKTYWFMFEPLMISRTVFERLPKPQQDVIMAVGTELESFALDSAKADDQAVAAIYQKAGGKTHDLSDAVVKKWQAIARDTAWKDFSSKSESCARLLKLAEQTI